MKKYIGIGTAIYGLFSIAFLFPGEFGASFIYLIAALFMMPITMAAIAKQQGKEKLSFVSRFGFGVLAFFVTFILMGIFIVPDKPSVANKEIPVQKAASTTPEPTTTPTQPPKPAPESPIDVKTLFATKPNNLDKALGKPISISVFKQNEYACQAGCENRKYDYAGLTYELIVTKQENRVNSAVIEPTPPNTLDKVAVDQLLQGASLIEEAPAVLKYTMPSIDSISVFMNGSNLESIFARIEY